MWVCTAAGPGATSRIRRRMCKTGKQERKRASSYEKRKKEKHVNVDQNTTHLINLK